MAIAMPIETERLLIRPFVAEFTAKVAGFTCQEVTHDYNKAFEAVLKFTGERIVADKPVRQHSICAGMLADMAIKLEAARQIRAYGWLVAQHGESADREAL